MKIDWFNLTLDTLWLFAIYFLIFCIGEDYKFTLLNNLITIIFTFMSLLLISTSFKKDSMISELDAVGGKDE